MSELIIYTSDDGQTSIKLRAEDGAVWLSQQEMAELFATNIPNINQHARKILTEGELSEATIKNRLIVQDEGGKSEAAQLFFKKVQNKMLWAIPVLCAPCSMTGARKFPVSPCIARAASRCLLV